MTETNGKCSRKMGRLEPRRTSLVIVVPALLLFSLMLLAAALLFRENFEQPTSSGRWIGSAVFLLVSTGIVLALFRDLVRRFDKTVRAPPPTFSPYENTGANDIYNLLFCDRRESFGARRDERTDWQRILFTEPPNVPELRNLAGDASQEGRIRYLAFARLREAGAPVTPKMLLGVIVEVALSDGLDALAAYSDGGVRYINHTGKMAIVEGVDGFRPLVHRLFEAAEPVVARIGPWDQPRRPPPGRGNARLTFLVSDGLYFGEAQRQIFERDALAGPVLREATQLLTKVVGVALAR